jgi:hypothetical protein
MIVYIYCYILNCQRPLCRQQSRDHQICIFLIVMLYRCKFVHRGSMAKRWSPIHHHISIVGDGNSKLPEFPTAGVGGIYSPLISRGLFVGAACGDESH